MAVAEEAERFDDVSVVRFVDEEQELECKRMCDRKHSSVLAENRRRDI
jgi:hypothetical protein